MTVKQMRSVIEAMAVRCARTGDSELSGQLRRLAAIMREADKSRVAEFVARVSELRRQGGTPTS